MISKNEKINKLYNKSIFNTPFLTTSGIPEVQKEFDLDEYTDLVLAEAFMSIFNDPIKIKNFHSSEIVDPVMRAFGFDREEFLDRISHK